MTRLLACLAAAALLSGCANMTPEERAESSYGPLMMRTTNCQRFGNTVNCTSW